MTISRWCCRRARFSGEEKARQERLAGEVAAVPGQIAR